MNPKEYIENVLKTEARDMTSVMERLQNETSVRLLHASIGLATETGEIQDALKKHLFYGKPIDRVNLIEEMGDMLWYIGVMAHSLEVDIEDVMDKNIAKLRARYGNKFTESAALTRDLKTERKILEE